MPQNNNAMYRNSSEYYEDLKEMENTRVKRN